MYDEDQINDSLEACRNLAPVKNNITTEELFAGFASLKEEKSCHTWEKISEAAYTGSPAGIKDPDDRYIIYPDSSGHKTVEKASASPGRKILRNAAMFAACVVFAFCLATFINTHVAHQTTIAGESMSPSLKNNDSVIIEKLSYRWKDPERYDVIVFPIDKNPAEDGDVYYIKRIIGLPGEVVQIINGIVYINGEELDGDNYSEEGIIDPGIAQSPVQLGDDEYFVLGDNRNMSTDSRFQFVGMVKRKDIAGEAWCCIWPFSHIKKL